MVPVLACSQDLSPTTPRRLALMWRPALLSVDVGTLRQHLGGAINETVLCAQHQAPNTSTALRPPNANELLTATR
jgi:hypothetical protein